MIVWLRAWLESWEELVSRRGFDPYWTWPKPEQLEDQVIVAPAPPAWATGPWVMEQVVGVEVTVDVLVDVEVGVDVAVFVGVNVGVSVAVEVGLSVEVSVGVEVKVGVGVKAMVVKVRLTLWTITAPFRLRVITI